ncbi:hypothetical protein D6416_23500 [Salmonella enterica subsp. enterica]|nr:hypothetical protein [Salmonella enterica subsp. enterica]
MPFYEIGKVYVGKPCKKCGSKVRYSNSRRCVQCKNALSKAEWERKKAQNEVEAVLEKHGIE